MAQAGPWTMLAADGCHTGRSTLSGPGAQAGDGALWTKQLPRNISSGLVLDDNGVVYVACRDARLYRYQAQSGSSEPTYNNRSQITSYTPAIADGLIYLGAGRQFSAVDMTTLASVWSYSNVGAVNSSPVIDTDSGSVIFASTLMFGPQDNKVVSLNSTTGAVNWEVPMPSNVLSSPALAGGRVYIGCDAGFIVALDATSGDQVWRYPTTGRVPGMIRTPPAVDVDRSAVYVATQASPINENQLLALNSNTGELLWSYVPGEYVPRYCCPVLASNGIIYVGFYGLHAIDPNDGSRLWRSSTDGNYGRYPGAAAIGSTNTVYFTTEDGKCLAYNADGTELFRFNGGHSSSPPAIGPGNSLYFADWNKNVFCLQTSAPAPVSTLPDVAPPVVGTGPPPSPTNSTDTIWWSQGSPGQFWTAAVGPTSASQTPVQADSAVVGFAIDATGGKLVWADDQNSIQKSNLDGSEVETVASGLSCDAWGLSVASGHTVIYCADPSQNTIYEITAIGGAQALFTNRNKPVQTAIDESASILFWVEFDSGLLMSTTGPSPIPVIGGLSHPQGIALDTANRRIFWIDDAGIGQVSYDGSGVASLLTMSPPQSSTDLRSRRIVLNQAADTLYWVDKSSNAIVQSPLINPLAQTLSIQPAPVSPELIAVVSINGTDRSPCT